MRLLLAIALLITSLPVAAPAEAASVAARPMVEGVAPVPVQTPTSTPTPTPDPVLEEAKREALIADELKKKAVSDKERAAAEIERLKALALPFGTPSNVQIPTGSVQTDAAGWVESQMLAHEAARQITRSLTVKLCSGNFMPGSVIPPVHQTATAAPPSAPAGTTFTGQQTPPPQPKPADTVNKLVIYNNNDLAGVELYNTVMGQLTQLKKEFESENAKAEQLLSENDPRAKIAKALPPAALPLIAAAPGIATGLIKSVAELLNLFRTETKFENKSVQISEDMVVSYLVNVLANKGDGVTTPTWVDGRCAQALQVYYPALFQVSLVESSENSPLVLLLNDVERLKNASALLVERIDARVKELNGLAAKLDELKKKNKDFSTKSGELATKKAEEKKACRKPRSAECKKVRTEIEELGKEIGQLEKDIAKLKADFGDDLATIQSNAAADNFKKWVVELNEQKSKLQSLINSTDLLSSRLNTPDATTKLSALAQLLRAEKLHNILKDPHTFTLRVAVTANGTTKIKKNLFVDAKVRHSAGANLVYQLFNRDGVLAQADVMQCYIDYRSAKDVYDIVSTPNSVVCRNQTPVANGGTSNNTGGNR